MKRPVGLSFAVLSLAGVGLMVSPSGAQSQNGPEVVNEIYHDTSRPVREYPSPLPAAAPAMRVRPLPRRVLPGAALAQADAVEQTFALPPVSATISHNFDGMPDSANGSLAGVPPDENLSVGATQVVEVINTAYQVFNKSGVSVQAPKQISSIFTGMSGLCGQGPTSFNYTDPIVLYDKKAGRWFIAIVAGNNTFSTGNNASPCRVRRTPRARITAMLFRSEPMSSMTMTSSVCGRMPTTGPTTCSVRPPFWGRRPAPTRSPRCLRVRRPKPFVSPK